VCQIPIRTSRDSKTLLLVASVKRWDERVVHHLMAIKGYLRDRQVCTYLYQHDALALAAAVWFEDPCSLLLGLELSQEVLQLGGQLDTTTSSGSCESFT
jgi:hypothetical protein